MDQQAITQSQDIKLAIKSVNELIEVENISTICYIDDKFDLNEQKEFFSGKMKLAKRDNIRPKPDSYLSSISWNVPDPVFSKQLDEFWEKSEPVKAIHEICNLIGDDDSSNIIPVLEIKQHFPKIELFSPDEWMKIYSDIFGKLSENERILCLFDYEFNGWEGDRGEKDGMDLIKKIINDGNEKKAVLGIFSHKFSIEDEDEKRSSYSSTYNVEPKYFCTVSKKRFAFDPQLAAFAEGVRSILMLPHIEDLKNISIEIINESTVSSLSKLGALSPKTFNQIVQKSSGIEGIWEANTLFRLFSTLQETANRNLMISAARRSAFNQSINKIRKIDVIRTGYDYSDSDKNAIEIRLDEIYIKGEVLNKFYSPISNGDIFRVGQKEFMLLGQPCNLALRKDGKRGNLDFDKGFLIPLKTVDKEKYNSVTSKILYDPTVDEGKVSCVVFPEFKTMSLSLLDLVVFNDQGKGIIDLKVEDINDELYHTPLQNRYTRLRKSYLKHEKSFIAFETLKQGLTTNRDLKAQLNVLSPHFKKPFCLQDFKVSKNIYNSQSRTLDFPIERIKHYKNPFSSDILQLFTQYISRNAFEHDILRDK